MQDLKSSRRNNTGSSVSSGLEITIANSNFNCHHFLKAMSTAGYSGKSLTQKLGIKEGFKIRLVNQPNHYLELLGELPEKTVIVFDSATKKNFIHYFTKDFKEFRNDLITLKGEMEMNGMLWISWPKKASKVATDLTEDIIRNEALATGLVDIKVCAVDETWSGLKLVIPVKHRT